MRDDIRQLIERRPSWILHNDKLYKELQEAIAYAKKGNNSEALEELEMWAEQRKIELLSKV